MIGRNHPSELASKISKRAQERRLELNITQQELADRSGVSFGSVKRFEQEGKISLKHLLMIAVVLRSVEEFHELFSPSGYSSVEEVVNKKKSKKRKRASREDS